MRIRTLGLRDVGFVRNRTPAFPSSGLLSYWRFESNLTDSFGGKTTTAAATAYAAGKNNQCYDMTAGVDRTITVSSPGYSFATGISFFCWVNCGGLTHHGMAERGPGGGNIGDFSFQMESGNKPVVHLNGASVSAASPTAAPDNTWAHVGFTYDKTTLKTWVNGVNTQTTNTTVNVNANYSNVRLGVYYNSYPLYSFAGYLDEAALWGRGLTLTEIGDLYNAGNGNFF